MPWELGYFDGIKSTVAVLPVAKSETNSFNRNEYLGLYPYLDTGIAIFIFGNKKDRNDENQIILADGVKKEFEIALTAGCLPIPIGSTGYMAKALWDVITADLPRYYNDVSGIEDDLKALQEELNAEKVISIVVRIVDKINKN